MALLLQNIPSNLSEKLVEEFLEIKKRFLMNDWSSGQLKGGRFAEVLLRIYQHLLGDSITPFGEDIPPNTKTRILNAVQSHGSIDDHFRQKTVPLARLLLDFRNNRDVAHLGGFNANSMDTLFVVTSATWILCELVRVYGGYAMDQAQAVVENLTIRDYPVIVERNGEIFITRHDLRAKQEVLVLLTKNDEAEFDFLFAKTRDRNKTRFQKTLDEMVAEKLIGLSNGKYFLLPRGMATVARESLLQFRRT
jgi:hypothetical protein